MKTSAYGLSKIVGEEVAPLETLRRRRVVRVLSLPSVSSQPIIFDVDGWLDWLRREVQRARESEPELQDYHLHDLHIAFEGTNVKLRMDFRK